nr:hypothetical protein [Mycoplasmopsis bovis]
MQIVAICSRAINSRAFKLLCLRMYDFLKINYYKLMSKKQNDFPEKELKFNRERT